MIRREGNFILAKFVDGDIIKNLENLAKEYNIKSAIILNGIGMLEKAVIGYFNSNDYIKKEIKEPAELVSLQGNIGLHENKPIIHAHVALARKNHAIVGGHLFEGKVKVVNEIAIYILNEIKIKRISKGKLMEMHLE